MYKDDLTTVTNVDMRRYCGLWYEIGHSPNFFQRLCERSTAEYSLESDGKISVLNTCYRANKPIKTIKGKAFIPDSTYPGKLIVDFGFFRKGDYWIIALDVNYQWAVVSGPRKSSLFILSRQAPMSPVLLKQILEDLERRGFHTHSIIFDKYS